MVFKNWPNHDSFSVEYKELLWLLEIDQEMTNHVLNTWCDILLLFRLHEEMKMTSIKRKVQFSLFSFAFLTMTRPQKMTSRRVFEMLMLNSCEVAQ